MPSVTSSVLYGLCLVVATHGSSIVPQWDLELTERPVSGSTKQLLRRYNPVVGISSVDASSMLLTVSATLGTPPQSLQFTVDIFNTITNFLSSTANICQSANGCPYGSFDASSSSTYKEIGNNFNVTYSDGTQSSGIYAQDTFSIGGTSVNGLQFAFVSSSNNNENILGLGYPKLDSTLNPYPNLPSRLTSDGDISLTAYSIWFDGEDFDAGKLAFGGVDTGKFSGTLQSVQISPPNEEATSPLLPMDNVYATVDGYRTLLPNSSADTIVDSTSNVIALPISMVTTLGTFLGASFDSEVGGLVQPYAAMKNSSFIGVTFAGVNIDIPLAHLVVPKNATYGFILLGTYGQETPVLGLPFLRSAYLVIDNTHNQVSFQKTVYNNASNVTTMPNTGVQGLQSTLNTTSTSSNPSTTTSSAPTQSTTSAHNNTAEKIGIGVGVGVGVPLLLAILGGLYFRRRRKHQSAQTSEQEVSKVEGAGAGDRFEKSELPAIAGTGTRFQKSELSATQTQISELPAKTTGSEHRTEHGNHVTELPGSSPPHFELSGTGSVSGSHLKNSDTTQTDSH